MMRYLPRERHRRLGAALREQAQPASRRRRRGRTRSAIRAHPTSHREPGPARHQRAGRELAVGEVLGARADARPPRPRPTRAPSGITRVLADQRERRRARRRHRRRGRRRSHAAFVADPRVLVEDRAVDACARADRGVRHDHRVDDLGAGLDHTPGNRTERRTRPAHAAAVRDQAVLQHRRRRASRDRRALLVAREDRPARIVEQRAAAPAASSSRFAR